MQIEDALAKFQLQLAADGRSKHTVRQYQRHVRVLVSWAEREGVSDDVRSFNHEALARFLTSDLALEGTWGTKKPGSVNALRSSLRGFFHYCDVADLVSKNPARLIRRARCGTPPPRGLSEDQVKRLLETLDGAEGAAAGRDRVLVRLLLATGIRLGSTLALEVGDLDFDACVIDVRVAKGNRPYVARMDAETVEMMRRFVEGRTGPVFTTEDGRIVGARQVQRRFGDWCEQAGLPRLGVHRLRHTYATKLYQERQDVLHVARALGHRTVHSAMRYSSQSALLSRPL